MPRLPVDFFSWHAFYVDPSRYYGSAVPYVRDALQQAGYPRNVPMINTEWNIVPVPPYAEGPVNATNVGAAFVASSLIAMQEAGVDAQSFQMYVDPGTPGYFGGMMTNHGVPRATFHAFTLFSMLKGRQVRVKSDDPWVKSVAFVDGNTAYLLISSAIPTAAMQRNTVSVVQTLRHGAFTKSLVRDGLAQVVARGQSLPPALAAQAREIEAQGDQLRRDDGQRADARRALPALHLVISGLGLPKRVTRYLIDSTHANVFPQLDSAARILDAETASYSGLPARLNRELRGAGLSARTSDAISRALGANRSLDRALEGISATEQQVARRVVLATVGQLMSQRGQLLRSIEAWPGAGLRADTVTCSSVRPFRVELPPKAVVLYVMQR